MRPNSESSKEARVLSCYVRSLEPHTGLEFTDLEASLWEVYLAFGLLYESSSSKKMSDYFLHNYGVRNRIWAFPTMARVPNGGEGLN